MSHVSPVPGVITGMKRILAIGALLFLVAGVFVVRGLLTQPPDKQLIEEALEEAALASREGRPGGVFDYISKGLQLNDVEVGTGRNVADYIRNAKPRVEFLNPVVEILGDDARVISDVTVQAFPMPQPIKVSGVTVQLAKETKMNWLVIPGKQWRIVRIDAPNTNMSDFAAQ